MKKVKIKSDETDPKKSVRLTLAQVQSVAAGAFDYAEMYSLPAEKAAAFTAVTALSAGDMWIPLSTALLCKDAPPGKELNFTAAAKYFSAKFAAGATPGPLPMTPMTAGEFRKGALAATRDRVAEARAALNMNANNTAAQKTLKSALEILAKYGWSATPKKRKVPAQAAKETTKLQTAEPAVEAAAEKMAQPDGKVGAKPAVTPSAASDPALPAAPAALVTAEKPIAELPKPAEHGEFLVAGDTYPVYAQLNAIGGGRYDKPRNVWVFPTKEKADKAQKSVDDFAAQRKAKTGAK